MSYSIGLGLALNILFWFGAVAMTCFVAVYVIKEFFPGGYLRNLRHARVRRVRHPGHRPVRHRNHSPAPPKAV